MLLDEFLGGESHFHCFELISFLFESRYDVSYFISLNSFRFDHNVRLLIHVEAISYFIKN